jgi:hypothetical protein
VQSEKKCEAKAIMTKSNSNQKIKRESKNKQKQILQS